MSNSITLIAQQDQALTKPQADLHDLATTVRDAHLAFGQAAEGALAHALRAGETLIAAKNQLGHRRWLPWLKGHCGLPERTAQDYMRLAHGRSELERNPQHAADLSLRAALKLINSRAPSKDEKWLSPTLNPISRAWIKASDAQRRQFAGSYAADILRAQQREASLMPAPPHSADADLDIPDFLRRTPPSLELTAAERTST
jgi:DUF3102 family protein